VHFMIDEQHADTLAEEWRAHGLTNLGLELIDCPDRRLTRSAVETVAHELTSGESEVCVLLPERKFSGAWKSVLHDKTAESLSREISRLPHANVTIVPFHFDDRESIAVAKDATAPTLKDHAVPNENGSGNGNGKSNGKTKTKTNGKAPVDTSRLVRPAGAVPIGEVTCRQTVKVHGRIQAMRVEPLGGSPSLECTLADETGKVAIVFFGRHKIDGISIGATVTVEGMAIDHHGRLAVVNPVYELR
jgi:hypothetical protein